MHVALHHFVNFGTPRRDDFAILDKVVDGLPAELANEVDCALQGVAVISHEDDDHIVGVAARLFDIVRKDILQIDKYKSSAICQLTNMNNNPAYIRPGHQIVRTLVECFDHWISHDTLRKIDVECVFDEVKDGLAPAGITSDINVGFKVWDDVIVACACLDVHGFKEQLKALLETCLDAGASVGDATSPVAVTFPNMSQSLYCKDEMAKEDLLPSQLPRVKLFFPLLLPSLLRWPVPLTEP